MISDVNIIREYIISSIFIVNIIREYIISSILINIAYTTKHLRITTLKDKQSKINTIILFQLYTCVTIPAVYLCYYSSCILVLLFQLYTCVTIPAVYLCYYFSCILVLLFQLYTCVTSPAVYLCYSPDMIGFIDLVQSCAK